MTTVAAGASQTFTAGISGVIYTVTVEGGSIGQVTGQGGPVALSPSGTRRGFGPLDAGQSITVSMQIGSANVTGADADGAQIIDPGTGLPLSTSGGVAPGRSTKYTDIKFASDTAGSNVGKTFEHVRSVPFAFCGGRLIAYSAGTAQASGVLQAAVSSQAAYNSASDAAPVSVTWNGATSPGAGGVFTNTRGSDGIMLGLSDPFVLASVARSDGGAGAIIAIRAEAAAAGSFIFSLRPNSVAAQGTQYNTDATYVDYSREATGTYVSTNKAGFAGAAAANANGNLTIFDVMLFGTSRVYSVGNVGDSLAQGQYGNRSSDNDIKVACDSLTLDGSGNVVYAGAGTMPGKGVATFGYRAVEYINKCKPDALVYQLWSPNDGSVSTAAISTSRAYLYQVIEACARNGVALVIRTSPLWQLFNATDHTSALAYHAEVQALCGRIGAQFVDIYAATANTSVSPPVLVAGYGWPTGTTAEQAHLNATAYTAIAPLTKAAIKAALKI
jgi:hypothetical protein